MAKVESAYLLNTPRLQWAPLSARFRRRIAQSQLNAARVIVTTSQRAVDVARTSAENGLATQMTLAQAEVNLASARYACEAALYDGEFAMGCR